MQDGAGARLAPRRNNTVICTESALISHIRRLNVAWQHKLFSSSGHPSTLGSNGGGGLGNGTLLGTHWE